MKKIVISILFFTWLLTFGVPYSEAMGLFQDHSQSDEQALAQLTSTSVLLPSNISSGFCTVLGNHPAAKNVLNIHFDYLTQEKSNFQFQLALLIQSTPPISIPKIFKLFSVYRL